MDLSQAVLVRESTHICSLSWFLTQNSVISGVIRDDGNIFYYNYSRPGLSALVFHTMASKSLGTSRGIRLSFVC